ncbi:hypothetical protein [Klebsiella spallanzanii]|uniref:hypothetical protein n=1 Tax=Klebsiella spallanzanii TaxID=2587528 RepID=UPI0011588CAF|nr:hypothetical protein [Klebsiella spallanzanii]VUS22499.1 hypothetical protein SB6419_00176 [Klebsiella spallanzanii]
MKELTIIEMHNVSGAGIRDMLSGKQSLGEGLIDTVIGATLAGLGGSGLGGLQGGMTGNGSGGGILGFGVITIGIGSIWGAIQGGISGIVLGAYVGAEDTMKYIDAGIQAMFDGTMGGWKPN